MGASASQVAVEEAVGAAAVASEVAVEDQEVVEGVADSAVEVVGADEEAVADSEVIVEVAEAENGGRKGTTAIIILRIFLHLDSNTSKNV